jgi:magnesium-transporting ATPase (P-type)
MKEYLQSASDVLTSLSSSPDNGLSASEAQKRLEQNGKNKLAEGKKESLLHRFLKQLAEPMTIILIVAAAISGALAFFESEFPSDVIIIMAVVLINAILGVLQESKAERPLRPCRKSPPQPRRSSATAVRSRSKVKTSSSEISSSSKPAMQSPPMRVSLNVQA